MHNKIIILQSAETRARFPQCVFVDRLVNFMKPLNAVHDSTLHVDFSRRRYQW